MAQLLNISQLSLGNFNLSEGFSVIWQLLPILIGIVIYSIFIFKFYRFVASRDVFKLNLNQYNKARHPVITKTLSVVFYIIEYIFIFPLFTFFWFLVLTILLSFMMEGQGLQTILLISIALVGAVRITAYYNQDLSKDLAKLVPFSLLSILLLNLNSFSFSASLSLVASLPSLWKIMFYYLMVVFFLELFLRILHGLVLRHFHPPEKEED